MLVKQLSSFVSVNNKFFNYILVIIGIYLAQTAFKISKCRKDGTFSWKELLSGMLDYSLYFLGIFIFFFAGTLVPNEQIVFFEGKSYSITDLLTMLMYILMVAQAKKCFDNISATFNIKGEIKENGTQQNPETIKEIG